MSSLEEILHQSHLKTTLSSKGYFDNVLPPGGHSLAVDFEDRTVKEVENRTLKATTNSTLDVNKSY